MVAEPVSATINALNSAYNYASSVINSQTSRIADSDLLNSVTGLFSNSNKGCNTSNSRYTFYKDSVIFNVKKHKIFYLNIFSLGIGISSILIVRKSYYKDKRKPRRRVAKLPNGARRDVVLIVGSPTEPMTRLIALDFEKRGMIVYLTILDDKDFKYVESNVITDDINYLNLVDSTQYYSMQLSKFQSLIETPVIPFPGASPHNLRLVSVVFAPCLYFPIGPIENITTASWEKVNNRLMKTFALFSSGLINILRSQRCKVITVNSNIISSLDVPYHAPESYFQNSMRHFFTSLTRELRKLNLTVIQVRLGNLYISGSNNGRSRISNLINSEIRQWSNDMRQFYASDFSKSQYKTNPMKAVAKDYSLKELYHLLFDLIYAKKNYSPVVFCGSGARTYDWMSGVFSEAFLEWFLT